MNSKKLMVSSALNGVVAIHRCFANSIRYYFLYLLSNHTCFVHCAGVEVILRLNVINPIVSYPSYLVDFIKGILDRLNVSL